MTRRRIWLMVIVWAFLSAALWASDAQPAVAVLGGVIAAVTVGGLTVVDLAIATSGVTWSRRRPNARPDPGAVRLHRLMRAGVRYDAPDLHATLVRVIDDRLLANAGVDRASEPQRAAALLSPRLRHVVDGRTRGINAPRTLHRIVTDIEAL